MNNLQQTLDELLNAPLRILEWQILSKHPELWGDEGITWLKEEREKAWKQKDFRSIRRMRRMDGSPGRFTRNRKC